VLFLVCGVNALRCDEGTHGLEEAIDRCREFKRLGADWTFLEAPQSLSEMELYCRSVEGPKLANMLEGGKTPVLSPAELQKIGFTVAAYPLTLLSASIKAMNQALVNLKAGEPTGELSLLGPTYSRLPSCAIT
jgi:2-methylisocitrate lyase-like PEP mutase family enzyme